MLELNVWGPAFDLPSFDAECIAATVYLNLLLPQDQWSLIPAHDSNTSPSGDFPALRETSTCTAGFTAIVKYLSSRGYSLDSHLDSRERADSIALSNHITTHSLPLIAHHLHSSPQSYTSTTLPAISLTLPPSVRYTLPSTLHSTALSRAAAAGLSSTDDDEEATQQTREPQVQAGNADHADAKLAGGISSPSLLFKRKHTLQAALRDEQSKMRFRVQAAVETLLEPVAEKLKAVATQRGKRRKDIYLLGGGKRGGPTSLDCLAFGYLSLLLNPSMQNSFLTGVIRKRYGIVVDYIDALRIELLGGTAPIDANVIMSSQLDHTTFFSLPWRRLSPPPPSSTTTTTTVLKNLTTPLSHLLLPSLSSRSLLPPFIHLYNNPFDTRTHTPLWLLTVTLTTIPSILAALGYFLFRHVQNEWVGWGGGETNKHFYRTARGYGEGTWGGVGGSTGGQGPWDGFGGDAKDVLGALFGPPSHSSLPSAAGSGTEDHPVSEVE